MKTKDFPNKYFIFEFGLFSKVMSNKMTLRLHTTCRGIASEGFLPPELIWTLNFAQNNQVKPSAICYS